jgi:hypothetical protein
MTSVVPPPPPPLPTSSLTGWQLTVTLASNQASIALSKMALDSLISGIIKQSSPQGETTLQTQFGPVSFKAPFQLTANLPVAFKLVQTSPAVQIQLTQINGKPVAQNTPATRIANLAQQAQNNIHSTTQTQNITAPNIQTTATNVNVNSATGLKAIVLSVLSNNQPTTSKNPSAPNAFQPSVNMTGKQPSSGASTNNISTTGNQTSSTLQNAPNINTMIQKGNQLNVRLLSVQQPNQTQSTQSNSATPPSSPNSVITQGIVNGHTSAQHPIIKTPQGLISLETSARMPEGSQVKLEILSAERPAISTESKTQSASAISDKQLILGSKWPALDEALSQIKEQNPLLFDALQQKIIPKPDQRMAANLVFFLKALGVGSMKNWMDEKSIKILNRTKPDLLGKLDKEFSQTAEKANTPSSTDWKIAYVPIQSDQGLQQIRIAQRDAQEQNDPSKEDPGVRFVIDLDLSKLGKMQLDGLAKDKQKKFDLIFRTHSALPGFIRKDIHDIFEKGMNALAFDGKLAFQVTPNFVELEGIELNKTDINLGMLV